MKKLFGLIVLIVASSILICAKVSKEPKKQEVLKTYKSTHYRASLPSIAYPKVCNTWLCYYWLNRKPNDGEVEKLVRKDWDENPSESDVQKVYDVTAYDEPQELKGGSWMQVALVYTEDIKSN
ncbi:MAG: hypothetical protein JWM20_717 [Patescibacteria group bacterium]|nr:hypothetical protein [Patescibacteria group bacterium]